MPTLKLVGLLILCAPLIGSCDSPGMDREEASKRLVQLVDDALTAGFKGQAVPDPDPVDFDPCTGRLGPTSQSRPTYKYVFPLTELGENSADFADDATAVWERHGMEVTVQDDETLLERFALSDDGFRFSLAVNRQANQVYIGGSGPCVDAAD